MTVLLVNNYKNQKEFRNRIQKLGTELEKAGAGEIHELRYDEIGKRELPQDLDAIVLSGSEAHLNKDIDLYKAEIRLVRTIDAPVLGICFGHQLIGKAFGSNLDSYEDGFRTGPQPVEVLQPDHLFFTWKKGDTIRIVQSHKDYLSELPQGFLWLAKSKECNIEAMKHRTKPIYGIQAHIERADHKNPDGYNVMRNFFSVVDSTHKRCVFCEMAKDLKSFRRTDGGRSKWITQDRHFFAILDKHPKVTGHTLVISKRHSNDLTKLTENEARSLGHILVTTARFLKSSLSVGKIYVMTMCEHWELEEIDAKWRMGKKMPSTTEHTHFHLLPRYEEMRTKETAQENLFSRPQDYGCTSKMLDLVRKKIRRKMRMQEKIDDARPEA